MAGKTEVICSDYVVNFVVNRGPEAASGRVWGAKAPSLMAGVWMAPAPQHGEKSHYLIDSGVLLIEGGHYLLFCSILLLQFLLGKNAATM